MSSTITNPYEVCPAFETSRYIFRLVEEEDAQDLMACYADPKAAPLFNSDNCTSNFVYHTIDEMTDAIRFWRDSYDAGYFIRFSVIDKAANKAVGTLEGFMRSEHEEYGRVGVLRIDLASAYETEATLSEILQMANDHFLDIFGLDCLITKAVPAARERIAALERAGYARLAGRPIVPYDDYFIRRRQVRFG